MTQNRQHFRSYSSNARVEKTYQDMQENQTDARVTELNNRYTSADGYTDQQGNKIRERIMDVFELLDQVIDESDPDTDLPQSFHAYQTGEALRVYLDQTRPFQLKEIRVSDLFSREEWDNLPDNVRDTYYCYLDDLYPNIMDWSWLPLAGFIHDLGKVLALKEWGPLPQSFVVGDTFPINAPFAEANVYHDQGFFKKNPNLNFDAPQEADKFGYYDTKSGFGNAKMSFGHDDYLYAVLKRTVHHLPQEALYLIRFHSFYPWHSPRDGKPRGYTELASSEDWRMLPLLKLFQRCDLYSKKDEVPNKKELRELKMFYESLITKFIPGRVESEHNLRPAKLLW